MEDGMYFYSMVSFLVLATVIVLVYIFLSLYLKKVNDKLDNIEKNFARLKKK